MTLRDFQKNDMQFIANVTESTVFASIDKELYIYGEINHAVLSIIIGLILRSVPS